MPLDSKKRPQSNSFLDSLQYPSIDRNQPSFNPEDVFLLPEDVGNFKKPRNIKNPITSTTPMAQSRMPTMTPSSMPTPRPSMPSMEEPQSEQDSTNFLGSLLAQGVASLGAGIQGGDIAQVGRSFEAGRQRAEQDRKAKALVDPKSEESKRRRMVFEKALDFKIPEEYSATDLNDPVVLQSIRDKRMQELAPKGGVVSGVRGGGVRPEKQPKPEKGTFIEDKDNDELGKINELRNLTTDLANSVKAKGNAWIGGASKEQDTLKYGIAATMGVLKGQGAMTEPDVEFWNKSLAISPSESKEQYSNRLKNLQQRLIDKQITKLKNKGFTVEYKEDQNKYFVFPKGESLDPIAEF
jgi:hypothetical protein